MNSPVNLTSFTWKSFTCPAIFGFQYSEISANFCARLTLSIPSLLPARLEHQRRRVHAIAQVRRRRAVVEHVTQVRVAAAAKDFCANAETEIALRGDVLLSDRLIETRPSGSRFKLGLRIE